MSCNSRITLLDRLGAGSFGEVYKVSHNDTGALMALKVILVNDQESLASAESEARIMAECASPNVVTIFEHWQEDLPGNKKQLLLMELCIGSLRDLINDYGVNNLAIDIDTIRTLARDITRGLAFIHSKGIIHRDLKPENILLSSDGVAKISDFGLSTWHSDGSSHTARIGTRTYRSPEQLLGSSSYTQAVDCWALGCTIAELFYGGYLFDWDTNLALLSQMARILGPINRATMPGDIDVSMVDSIQPPAHFYLLDRLVATNRECADPSSPTESYERSVHRNTSSMASRPVLLATDQDNDFLLSLCKLHNPGSDTRFPPDYMEQYGHIVSSQETSLCLPVKNSFK